MKKVYLSIFYFLFLATYSQAQKSPGFSCGINNKAYNEQIRQTIQSLDNKKAARMKVGELPQLECQVAVTIDKSMYDYYKGDKDYIRNYVYYLFGKVSAIYEKELNIKVSVSNIEFWESREYVNIYDFADYALQIPQSKIKRHINHLLKIGYTDNESGGIAFLGEPVSVSGFANASYIPNITKIMAHEIGHNFGSIHTHDCDWPGGQIDFCETGNCEEAQPKKDLTGTIMSYCTNTALTFHPLCVEVIRYYAEKNLPVYTTAPKVPAIDAQNIAVTTPKLQTYLNWNFSDKAQKYKIQMSESVDFTSTLIDSTLYYNQFQTVNLSNGKTYYWRVKAINEKGESGWSSVASITTKAEDGIPETPIIKSPLHGEEDVRIANLSFYPIPGATEYEIEVLDRTSFVVWGVQPGNVIKTKETSVMIDLGDDYTRYFMTPEIIWRVRAKTEQGFSQWTKYNYFIRGVFIIENYPTENKTDIPIKSVFSWQPKDPHLNKKGELQVSSTSDFSADIITEPFTFGPVFQKNMLPKPDRMQILDLKPATNYYYRLRDANNPDVIWAKNSFRTADSDTEVRKWKYLYDKNGGLPYENYRFFMQPNTNHFWTIRDGITMTDGVNWTKMYDLKDADGALSSGISNMTFDSKGNIWLSSWNKLVKFSGKDFTVFNAENSLIKNQQIAAIAIGKEDKVHVFIPKSNGVVMYTYDGKNWIENNTPLPTNETPVVHVDKEKNVWIAQTYGEHAIYKLTDDNTWTTFPIDRFTQAVNQIYSDKNGDIWVSGSIGVAKMLKNGEWSYMRIDNGFQHYGIRLAFNNKNIPYATFKNAKVQTKLFKYVDEQWVDLTKKTTPIDAINTYGSIIGFDFDQKNRLWICPSNLSMFIYDDDGVDNVQSQTITAQIPSEQSIHATPFPLVATATSGLPVAFTVLSGPASVSGNILTLSGEAGIVCIRAFQEGNEQFEAAKFVDFSFEVIQKKNQIITLSTISTRMAGDTIKTPLASTDSGLPLVYTVVAGPAKINSNNYIVITGAGKIQIKATQEGNQYYYAAKEVLLEFCASPSKPLITADATNALLLTSSSITGNQWYENGVKIEGATTASYLTNKNGQYTVEALNPDPSCPTSISNIFQVLILANEPEWTKEIKVFPNPISAKLSVVMPGGVLVEKISIHDITGKKVYETNKAEIEYDISGLTKGVFLISIQTNKGKALKKVVKD